MQQYVVQQTSPSNGDNGSSIYVPTSVSPIQPAVRGAANLTFRRPRGGTGGTIRRTSPRGQEGSRPCLCRLRTPTKPRRCRPELRSPGARPRPSGSKPIIVHPNCITHSLTNNHITCIIQYKYRRANTARELQYNPCQDLSYNPKYRTLTSYTYTVSTVVHAARELQYYPCLPFKVSYITYIIR